MSDIHLAQDLLKDTGISILDAAKFVQQILDGRSEINSITGWTRERNFAFCRKIINAGLAQSHLKDVRIQDGFDQYLDSKRHLLRSSRHDIRYLGNRLFKKSPYIAQIYFSELRIDECALWLSETFSTHSQYNKARVMLNGLFQYAAANEWCYGNIISYVPKKMN